MGALGRIWVRASTVLVAKGAGLVAKGSGLLAKGRGSRREVRPTPPCAIRQQKADRLQTAGSRVCSQRVEGCLSINIEG